ncbi:hypothetical protein D9757_005696 [Collybiopsis confluens]|uniref:Ribonuclease H1 N-terminal domain-containing protein n=1 Tax=Collybiopsis confluens TaxID=2823264 RepID=A0A8H5MCD3_9AGAR|nr:hypothetical protein D9757_015277 [Collybiopsis confluens]KAF5388803.1 hypothetical protein D9757_005698 [Collybiopsis confluens]KAF5388807.1 hypothetical protein D9757_005696 [Collybiopsis confluens]
MAQRFETCIQWSDAEGTETHVVVIRAGNTVTTTTTTTTVTTPPTPSFIPAAPRIRPTDLPPSSPVQNRDSRVGDSRQSSQTTSSYSGPIAVGSAAAPSVAPSVVSSRSSVVPVSILSSTPSVASIRSASPRLPSSQSPPQQSRPGIPHPTEIIRPQPTGAKFYVVFSGTQVGIFGDWLTQAQKFTQGISNAHHRSFRRWDHALAAYTNAYNGNGPTLEKIPEA